MLQRIDCPYCGEAFDTMLDVYHGDQDYIEDCPVCCRPVEFSLHLDAQGEILSLAIRRDDD